MDFKGIFVTISLLFFIMSAPLHCSSGVLIIKADNIDTPAGDIATIRITPKSTILYQGGCMQFVATAYDLKGKKIPFAMHWEVKSEVQGFGTLDKSDGSAVILNADNPGEGTLEAVYGCIKAVIPVEIRKTGR